MHYLADYGLFLSKTITALIAFLIFFAGTLALIAKNKISQKNQITVESLNEKFNEMEATIKEVISDKQTFKKFIKQREKHQKKIKKSLRKIFVLKFTGDMRASRVELFRKEITAVLSVATPRDEVVVCLESPGGLVYSYGLAASQLQRIRDKKIPLTIIIDKVAASGGYLMACVGDKILAAPFAIIGSIGVIAQLPNFHRWLEKRDIDFEQVTAGEYKRTLTVFGENTSKAREKLKDDLEEIQHYFKAFISLHRPQVNIDEVATGEHWLASKALELKLIDELNTSDDYLFSHHTTAEILKIKYIKKKSMSDKFSRLVEGSFAKLFYRKEKEFIA